MDAPAGRGDTRGLRRTCTAPAVAGAVTGADAGPPRQPLAGAAAATDANAASCVLALEGGAPRDDRAWSSPHSVTSWQTDSCYRSVVRKCSGAARCAPAAAFNPPPHSIAVLPFVNMSGDKEQEYFSDGLTEELLNSLAEINELQVAARTSAFSFKGKDTDIGTIARKLNVGAVLEGSVRRSAHTIRITAQLINAVTGFHLWSKTYDRDLGRCAETSDRDCHCGGRAP